MSKNEIKNGMKKYAVEKTGKPEGRGTQAGYSLGQSQELTLHCLDYLCDQIEELHDYIDAQGRAFTNTRSDLQ